MSETPPMLSGTGAVSTWTGTDPADRDPGNDPVDENAHVTFAGGGQLSTWTGADPATLAAPEEQALRSEQLVAVPPQDPPVDPPVE